MDDLIHDLISKLSQELNKKKEELLISRIDERVPSHTFISFEKESLRRFPRLMRNYESIDQSEHWYWNDNSVSGLRLISFYTDNEFSLTNNTHSVNARFTYK